MTRSRREQTRCDQDQSEATIDVANYTPKPPVLIMNTRCPDPNGIEIGFEFDHI